MIRKRLLIGWLFLCTLLAGCASQGLSKAECHESYDSVREHQYYSDVDIAPQYPGGQGEILKYIMKNYRLPENDAFQARFVLEFIVDTNGKLIGPSISGKKTVDLSASEIEILRVVNEMPKWEAARCGTRLVPAKVVLPITF